MISRLGVVASPSPAAARCWVATLRIPGGVLVAARTPTSTLLGEGPQPGDIIHAVNGTPIQDLTAVESGAAQI